MPKTASFPPFPVTLRGARNHQRMNSVAATPRTWPWQTLLVGFTVLYPMPYLALRTVVPESRRTVVTGARFFEASPSVSLQLVNPEAISMTQKSKLARWLVESVDGIFIGPCSELEIFCTGQGWRL